MKRIGSIKGVPVIEGNTNEVKKDQIHYKEDQDGTITLSKRDSSNTIKSISGGKSDGGASFLYYKIDKGNENFPTAAELLMMLPIIGISNKEMGGCAEIFVQSGSSSTNYVSAYETYRGYAMSDLTTPAILKISTAPYTIFYNGVAIKIDSGDAYKKVNEVLVKILNLSSEELEECNQFVKMTLVPATEDEYLSGE